jgi:hypothetical protein
VSKAKGTVHLVSQRRARIIEIRASADSGLLLLPTAGASTYRKFRFPFTITDPDSEVHIVAIAGYADLARNAILALYLLEQTGTVEVPEARLFYVDCDGDAVEIMNDYEVMEAIREYAEHGKSLRIFSRFSSKNDSEELVVRDGRIDNKRGSGMTCSEVFAETFNWLSAWWSKLEVYMARKLLSACAFLWNGFKSIEN